MKAIKLVAFNAALLFAILGLLEVSARLVAPEYVGAYFTRTVTRGYPILLNKRWGHRVTASEVDSSLTRLGDETRILFVGDSVTFGYGVAVEDAYHAVAGREIMSARNGILVHGVGKYNTDLPNLVSTEFGEFIRAGFGPDIMIYQFNPNDLEPLVDSKSTRGESLTAAEKIEKFRQSYLNRSAFLKAFQSLANRVIQRSRKHSLDESLRYSPATSPAEFSRRWAEFEQFLREFNAELDQLGIQFAILTVPEAFRISSDKLDNEFGIDTRLGSPWPEDRVAQIGARLGIPVFPALPRLQEFRRLNPGVRLYFPNDQNHPNRVGHAVIGDVAAEAALSLVGDSKSRFPVRGMRRARVSQAEHDVPIR